MSILASADLEHQIISLSLRTVAVSTFILVLFTLLSVLLKKTKFFGKLKPFLFFPMAGTLAIATIILLGGTVYLNTRSESKGPVHWHADIEFWSCNAELELRNPQGALTNKIGTSTYHEHNDKRIHLEGVVVRKSTDASLEKFMRVAGGYLTDKSIGVPLNSTSTEWFATAKSDKLDGDKQNTENFNAATGNSSWVKSSKDGAVLNLNNGAFCNGDEGSVAEVQVFVYRYNKADRTYSQTKLAAPTDYIMRAESLVPPGDCVIVEFNTPRDRTDKLCEQYGVRDAQRCVEFGVKAYDPRICNLQEVASDGGNQ